LDAQDGTLKKAGNGAESAGRNAESRRTGAIAIAECGVCWQTGFASDGSVADQSCCAKKYYTATTPPIEENKKCLQADANFSSISQRKAQKAPE
jgi:hypothetical protein